MENEHLKALIDALQMQRNQALDALAQTQAQLALANAQIHTLKEDQDNGNSDQN